jgi:hypothetical protein
MHVLLQTNKVCPPVVPFKIVSDSPTFPYKMAAITKRRNIFSFFTYYCFILSQNELKLET